MLIEREEVRDQVYWILPLYWQRNEEICFREIVNIILILGRIEHRYWSDDKRVSIEY